MSGNHDFLSGLGLHRDLRRQRCVLCHGAHEPGRISPVSSPRVAWKSAFLVLSSSAREKRGGRGGHADRHLIPGPHQSSAPTADLLFRTRIVHPFAYPVNPKPQTLQHPCGADEYVTMEENAGANYSTCVLTLTSIQGKADYALATHAVPCPSDVCVAKCNATGAATGFQCYNTSVTMDATQDAANNRGLAMGCPGSHGMNNTMFMAGKAHGDCEAGHVHYAHEEHTASAAGAAVARVAALVGSIALGLVLA